MIINLLLNSGYYIGIGIEAAVALVAGVLLTLLLAGVMVKNEKEPVAESAALVPVEDHEVEPVDDNAEGEVVTDAETVAAVPYIAGEQQPAQENSDKEEASKQQPIIINVYNGAATAQEPAKEEQPEKEEEPEKEEKKDGSVKFTESKTIEELYAELSPEQKSFFDELKRKALSKPQAVLSVTKNYENVKIGKHSIIKLLVRKGVTVAEFLLESDALKEYRKNSANKKGKSKIHIRPTVIAITELDTLKTALDMIDLAHEQMFED